MEKLVAVVMGQNCERFIGMAIESVKDADAIVYCDGGSTDNTLDILKEKGFCRRIDMTDEFETEEEREICWKEHRLRIICQHYDQEDKGMNGKQRNFYLQYVKENYPDWWCLAIDADEVVEDLGRIKEFIQTAKPAIYSIKMRHFIGDIGHEDSIVPEHMVLNRLFKISEADCYPEVEHPVLQGKQEIEQMQQKIWLNTRMTTIWHLAYIPNLWEMKKRYENHMRKSNMHTPQFLKEWYFSHIFGSYPKKEIKFIEIPPIILREFGIEPDEIYFATHNRLEVKHFLMMRSWIDYFYAKQGDAENHSYKLRILDMGCGWGMYGYVAGMLGANWHGIEKSKYACENSFMKDKMRQGDILEYEGINKIAKNEYDMVLLIDILEHLDEKDLDKALENMKDAGDVFIISLPFEGDPNLMQDPTHRIFKSREWWISKLGQYLKIEEAPKEWVYHNQILIGTKNG